MQIAIIVLVSITIILLVVLILKKPAVPVDEALKPKIDAIASAQERAERTLREELSRNREEAGNQAKLGREETTTGLKGFTDTVNNQMKSLTQSVELKMKELREENDKKLEQMRQTVDEKLHTTLEKRLGESFKLVSTQLESVNKGLGEMQALAQGVSDLKKVISVPKTKGILGEYQLNMIIKDLLTTEQYVENAPMKKKDDKKGFVEFAVKMPGKAGTSDPVLLPIDSKFPAEDFQKLIDAFEKAGSKEAIETAGKALENKIRAYADDIAEYIDPPNTTDFAVMFLPFESLYAEVLRRPGLFERVRREAKIVITGPTTLTAFLNALQMGFRTMAVQQRSVEIWDLLQKVKKEFENFGAILSDTREKLLQAANKIEDAEAKTTTINRALKKVEQLPASEDE